jgi:alpha-tubulin suppressor-like RCC1 family protein
MPAFPSAPVIAVALFAMSFACGCTWSSAMPLSESEAGEHLPGVSEDAGGNATPSPPDDADIPLLVDASALDAGVATTISAGGQETCAATSTGSAWCWGSNVEGELGTAIGSSVTLPGSTEAIEGAFVPVQVMSTMVSNSAATAVGYAHACSLTLASAGGGVQCWGADSYGQLGRAGLTTTPTPIAVPGIAGATAIAAGGYHTCALVGGSVKCWGDDDDGELGNGATVSTATPVSVLGLSGVAALTAGGAHTCALTTAGAVECWGLNSSGQLGDGTTTTHSSPVSVSGLASGVTAIAAGNSHTCALTNAGEVLCWGWGFYGQLGNNSTNSSSVPVSVGGLTEPIAIATGGTHSCALEKSGAALCWGDDQSGQLGNNQSIDSDVPVPVMGLAPNGVAIVAGTAHTCVLIAGGTLQCWGWNVAGQLGNDTGADSATAVSVLGFQ